MKAIYFDMDGTIADFYSVENWLEDLRMENVAPYILAKPMLATSPPEFSLTMKNRTAKTGLARLTLLPKSWKS